jgi:hypothetical protein
MGNKYTEIHVEGRGTQRSAILMNKRIKNLLSMSNIVKIGAF